MLAAARALGLDFVRVAEERYDLVIAKAVAADPRVERLLDIVRSEEFRRALESLGGYDARETGRVVRG